MFVDDFPKDTFHTDFYKSLKIDFQLQNHRCAYSKCWTIVVIIISV